MPSYNVRVLRSRRVELHATPRRASPPSRRLVEGAEVLRAGSDVRLAGGGEVGLAREGEEEAAPPNSLYSPVIDLSVTVETLDEQENADGDGNVAQEGDMMTPEIVREDDTLDLSAILDIPAFEPQQAAPVLAPITPPRQQDLNGTIDLTHSPTLPPESPATPTSPCTGPLASLLCPVCLNSLEITKKKGRRILSTSCGHVFCGSCLPRSLASTGRCPSCRSRCTSLLLAHVERRGSQLALIY